MGALDKIRGGIRSVRKFFGIKTEKERKQERQAEIDNAKATADKRLESEEAARKKKIADRDAATKKWFDED